MCMKINKIIRTGLILIILSSNIACDQISKKLVRQKINYYEQVQLVSSYVTLTKVENSGAFLGLGDSLPQWIKLIVLKILPLLAIAYAIIFLLTKDNLSWLTLLGISFLIGGGTGNLFDRLIYGSVTDFLHMDFIIFHTGVFNMADVSVMTGMFILLGEFYLKKKSDLKTI
jgi:signal peptidase II